PTWHIAAGTLSLNACAHTGHGLSVFTHEHASTVAPTDWTGARGPLPRDHRGATGVAGSPLHRGRPDRAGDPLLAAGRPARRPALGPCRGERARHHGARRADSTPRRPGAHPARRGLAAHPPPGAAPPTGSARPPAPPPLCHRTGR